MLKRTIIITAIVIATLFVSFFVVMHIFNNYLLKKETKLLLNRNSSPKQISFNSTTFSKLPTAVKKYLRKNVIDTSNPPRYCQFRIDGKTRLDENSDWLDFSSQNYYSATSPEFIKIVETQDYDLFWTKTLQKYINKKASTKSKFMSSIPTYSFAGSKLQRSYLVLYLLESVFCPTVLFPDMNIQWDAIDGSKALATIWNEELNGTAVFHFNKNGEVIKIVTDDRYMRSEFDYDNERFTIHFTNYQNVGKFNIPTYFEYQWNHDGRDINVGRFQITEITYE